MRIRVRVIAIMTVVAATAVGFVPASFASAPAKEKFTGDPITVAAIGDLTVPGTGREIPEVRGGVEARAEAINDGGGLRDASGKTHKVKVFVCDGAGDPNIGQACAREAESKGAIASLGFGSSTDQILGVFDAAGVPSIGLLIRGPSAGTLKSSFPLSNITGLSNATVALMVDKGATTIGRIFTSDIGSAGSSTSTFFRNAIEVAGAKEGPSIGVPRDQLDLAPIIAQVTPETDGIVVGGANLLQVAQEITLLRDSGYKGKIALPGVSLNDEFYKTVGKAGDGVLTPHLYPVSSTDTPGMKKYRDDMRAFNKKIPLNDTSLNGWLSMWLFERVAATVATIDRPSMLTAMNNLTDFDMGGITPPLTTTEPSQIPGIPFTRVFNQTVTWGVIKKGKIVEVDSNFHNPYTGEAIPNVALESTKKDS